MELCKRNAVTSSHPVQQCELRQARHASHRGIAATAAPGTVTVVRFHNFGS